MARKPDMGLVLALMGLLACGRQAPPPPPPAPLAIQVRLVAVGDVLMHEDVKRSAAAMPEGIPGLWQDVTPLFKASDLAFANLETVIAPKEGRPGMPFVFNAPAELAKALTQSGVTVVSTANNHTFDQGAKGLAETHGHLLDAALLQVGSGRTQAEAETPLVVERQGIRFALLAYTDLFNNNLNHTPDQPWVQPFDPERSAAAVQRAKASADVVVVSLHWGNEYWLKPTDRQKSAAATLVAAGADLILGHHPHVLEPVERLHAGGRTGVVAYSLGNFVSNQDRMYQPKLHPPKQGDNRDGAALVATFVRNAEGVSLQRVDVEPLWTDNNWLRRQSGADRKVAIQVIRILPTLEKARAHLAALQDAVQGPQLYPEPRTLQNAQQDTADRIKLLETRLERIKTTLGTLSLEGPILLAPPVSPLQAASSQGVGTARTTQP